MDIVTLMANFSDPETLHNLSAGQKLTASLVTTLLGMGITLVSLIVLQFVITILAKIAADKPPMVIREEPVATESDTGQTSVPEQGESEKELVAAITVALAMQLGTSTGNIVIRNIKKVENQTPVWSRAGLAELMDNSI